MLPDCKHERLVWQQKKTLVIAVDEAGRGPLAGPVVACAFSIAPKQNRMPHPPIPVKDSKQLSARQREKLYAWLLRTPHFCFATASVFPQTIDAINIRQANFEAMRRAIAKLEHKLRTHAKKTVFVDGKDMIPGIPHAQYTFIKGDARVFSIACASIAAKVTRDAYMKRMAKKYPSYGFEIHKGYGTLLHRRLIKKHGLSPIHRKTFAAKFTK